MSTVPTSEAHEPKGDGDSQNAEGEAAQKDVDAGSLSTKRLGLNLGSRGNALTNCLTADTLIPQLMGEANYQDKLEKYMGLFDPKSVFVEFLVKTLTHEVIRTQLAQLQERALARAAATPLPAGLDMGVPIDPDAEIARQAASPEAKLLRRYAAGGASATLAIADRIREENDRAAVVVEEGRRLPAPDVDSAVGKIAARVLKAGDLDGSVWELLVRAGAVEAGDQRPDEWRTIIKERMKDTFLGAIGVDAARGLVLAAEHISGLMGDGASLGTHAGIQRRQTIRKAVAEIRDRYEARNDPILIGLEEVLREKLETS